MQAPSYTVYHKHKSVDCPNGCVGITFQPTPSLSYVELLHLLQVLGRIEREMRAVK